ncbi:GGDEF domain-containing protein [Devosia sp. WQ 349]|uniref:GGDEF domain-containing protein n=1 Tax=Devosia sp. WQ 349K1 TaxID=2800329 RepID=UPI0019037044|nr:GGDEF domain-containing protein [Devosia sp. WQ 349K1]MBK1793511.1 GGDEF domain-containing protein [Devosia sp. WQ 349K1]
MSGSLSFALLNPLICMALAITVFCVSRAFPKATHLHYVTGSLIFTAIAFAGNDLFPNWKGPTQKIVVNLAFYLGINSAAIAALKRLNLKLPIAEMVILAGVTSAAFLWFLLVAPSTDVRIYVVNSAFAIMATTVIWMLLKAKPSSRTDWVFIGFAALLLVAAIVRPLANALGALNEGPSHSAYWMSVIAFTPLISVYCALVFMWALGKQVYEELREEAGKDYLTGLLNRRGFDQSTALLHCKSDRGSAALIVADIDNFKSINDTFGHSKGDQILRLVAETLSQLSPGAAVARTGGEEFSIYWHEATRLDIEQMASAVAAALTKAKSRLLPHERELSLSFGASIAANKTLAEMTLIADAALYQSKATGKNCISFG